MKKILNVKAIRGKQVMAVGRTGGFITLYDDFVTDTLLL